MGRRGLFRAGSVVTVAAPGTDLVVEGEARIVRDETELRRIATLYDDWGPQVRNGALWRDYSAPSAGPPPWDVYEITPTTVYGARNRGAVRRDSLAAVIVCPAGQLRSPAGAVSPAGTVSPAGAVAARW